MNRHPMVPTPRSPIKKADPSARRWFMDADDDGHTYLIPVDCREKWEKWLASAWQDSAALPVYVRQVDYISGVTFLDPCEGEPGPNDGARVVIDPR